MIVGSETWNFIGSNLLFSDFSFLRWQKLKEIFDVLVEKGDIEERELADSFNERKNAMDLLRLPQNENNTQKQKNNKNTTPPTSFKN